MRAGALKLASDLALQTGIPHFRLLRSGPRTQGLKLEPLWWDALEAMAEGMGLSPAELVFLLLEDLPEGENKTAYIRRCILARLTDESRRTESAGVPLRDMARFSPVPMLIVSERRGLIEINALALRDLERRLMRLQTLTPELLEIRPRKVIDGLFALLGDRTPATIDYDLRLRACDAALTVTVRASLFPGAALNDDGPADCAACFLLPPR